MYPFKTHLRMMERVEVLPQCVADWVDGGIAMCIYIM